MTYGSERVLWKGQYGWVHRVALNLWNAKNRNARAEYYKHPFINRKHHNNPVTPRRRWFSYEISYLRNARERKVPYEEIARYLGRSRQACQAKAGKLGIVKKWSPK